MQVIWNGCKDSDGGPYLFVERPQIVAPVHTYGLLLPRVRSILPSFGDREFSTEELQQAAQITRGQAASVISYLCRIGTVTRGRKRAMRSQCQVYRVVR